MYRNFPNDIILQITSGGCHILLKLIRIVKAVFDIFAILLFATDFKGLNFFFFLDLACSYYGPFTMDPFQFYLSMALQPLWTLGAFSIFNLYTVGRTPRMGGQSAWRPLPTHRTTQTQNKRTQTSIPRVGFKPRIPVFDQAKTVHALDRSATVIGKPFQFIVHKITVRQQQCLELLTLSLNHNERLKEQYADASSLSFESHSVLKWVNVFLWWCDVMQRHDASSAFPSVCVTNKFHIK
jgi:hypothetical protein